MELDDLRSGKLANASYVKLACCLTDIPPEIFGLRDSLEILDLSNNQLSKLPDEFSTLTKLRILFLSNNHFEVFPAVLRTLPSLDIIGFKANRISQIPEHSLPENIRWLILTGNLIEKLPASIGMCKRLQKVMLAGNRLSNLPAEMVSCRNIELLRISANQLTVIPSWLYTLPKLAWLAFAGNPAIVQSSQRALLPTLDWYGLEIREQLGQGASGIIYKALLHTGGAEVAVKIFKGEVTSDGWPEDEMQACIQVGNHINSVNVLSALVNHPDSKQGLIFELISTEYKILGLPPDFETCTRDRFPTELTFSAERIWKIANSIADVLLHFHERGIMHGDLYAHNILINSEDHSLLTDFGAATLYNPTDAQLASKLERLDVRAFGCLVDDLLSRAADTQAPLYLQLMELRDACLSNELSARPDFKSICSTLKRIR